MASSQRAPRGAGASRVYEELRRRIIELELEPGRDLDETALAAMWTAIAAAFALWSVALIVWKRQKALDLPQWTLFAVIASLGAAGLV